MLTRTLHTSDARAPVLNHVHRALIIDDDYTLASALADCLAHLGVETAISSGDNLQPAIESFDPHLILLDVRLLGSDAFSVIRWQIPPGYMGVVSIFSATGLNVIMDVMLLGEKRGLRMGPPMLKPFHLNELRTVLSAADDMFARRAISDAARHSENVVPEITSLRLRQALQQGLLEIWYQPKYDATTGLLSGAEALIRARPADRDVVLPHTLLKGADKTDLFDLTDFVLTGAVEHTALLGSAGWHGRLSVNVPLSYLLKRDAPRLLRKQASTANWPGMVFEITADEALGEDGDIEFLASQLKLYSVALSIDDFGAGYSSLARLRDLPFSELKLDRSFVQGCATDSVKQTICRNVLALGAELGISTVAEGVETEDEMRLCIEWGCDQVQGFLLAKPMPFADLLGLVQEHSPQLEHATA